MCGLAFSGKSSVAAILVRELKTELISLDAINDDRGLCGGEGMSDRQWEETSAIAMHRLRQWLGRGRSVVVDDTFRIASYATVASASRTIMAPVF